MSMITAQPPVSRTKFNRPLNLSLFQFLRIVAIAAVLGVSFVSCGILDLSGKDEKKEQTEQPKEEPKGEPKENPGGEEPGGNQPGGNNPGGEQPGENPGGETPGGGEEPGGQQEQAKVQNGAIQLELTMADVKVPISVTGNMTDSQWAIAFQKLGDVINGPGDWNESMLASIFGGIPPPKIVLETSSVEYSRYKIDKVNSQDKKIFINTNHIDAITFWDVVRAYLNMNQVPPMAKVDVKDTVRMAKAPVNGKALSAQDTRRYWLGYFLLET